MLTADAFRVLLENTSDMIFVKDIHLKYVAASIPFVRMVGKEKMQEIIDKTDLEIFEDKDLARRYVSDDYKLLENNVDLLSYIEPITEKNGHARYGETSKFILRDTSGNPIGLLGITKDITREYMAKQHYQRELQYLFELPKDTYAAAYIDIDDWRVISQRRQIIGESTLQSCETVEELSECAVASILDKKCEAALFYKQFNAVTLKEIYKIGKTMFSFQYQRVMPDESIRWVRNDVRFLNDADNGHLCMILLAKDIHAKKQEEYELTKAAEMDKMTMLYNRETVMTYIHQILEEHPDHMHALFMIDIDNFKTLNDTLGHLAGDAYLISLADEIKSCFRENDIKGRIGGDEFFVLMKNVPDTSVVERKSKNLIERIQKLSENYPGIHVSGSIGISLYPIDGKTLNELYLKADQALYNAKRNGKNQFVMNGN